MQPLQLARPIAYVELFIRGGASVGLVGNPRYRKSAHIGWHAPSIGYHGDEGTLYCNNGVHSFEVGPTFGLDPQLVVANDRTRAPRKADVVGVGIIFSTRT